MGRILAGRQLDPNLSSERCAKYLVFQLAELAGHRQLFAAILYRIGRLRLAEASG
jgi:hypothetical protein